VLPRSPMYVTDSLKNEFQPTPVSARLKDWFLGSSLAGIAGSNVAEPSNMNSRYQYAPS